MNINPTIQTDYYKVNHHMMYPPGTTKIYSNLTPRKSRLPGVNAIVVFGIQYWILEYVIKRWNEGFFAHDKETRKEYTEIAGIQYKENLRRTKEFVISEYKRTMDNTLGKGAVSTKHLEDLWDLGYMPLHIKALPEGSLCPIGVPCLTITITVDHAYWLVNYLETILSCSTWQAMTSATIAYEYKKLLLGFAEKTGGAKEFVQWQGHDFSMRGMSSLESACISGAAHLLSFTGTDTIPAISFLESYYGADVEKELVGASVPATEHSVMCMGGQDDEIGTFTRLLDAFPTGILSVVSDTWNLWTVCTSYLPTLKEKILKRDGKLVIRPDSGDPVDIICGNHLEGIDHPGSKVLPQNKGVIELLWDIFGGTINDKGYKQLDPHIGAIYGDSITLDRAQQICERLAAKGFASTNIVFGIGSYTYQHNTRDTFGFAVKATYGEVLTCADKDKCKLSYQEYLETCAKGKLQCKEAREIFKAPITDDGTKKSAKGLLVVTRNADTGKIELRDQQSKEEERFGLLETVFLDGKLLKAYTLKEIRERLNN